MGKEKVKLPLFVEDMILYIENNKNNTKKLIELIENMSKFDKNHNILSIKIIYLQGKLKKRNQSEKIYLQYILIYLTKHLYSEYIKKLPKQ